MYSLLILNYVSLFKDKYAMIWKFVTKHIDSNLIISKLKQEVYIYEASIINSKIKTIIFCFQFQIKNNIQQNKFHYYF